MAYCEKCGNQLEEGAKFCSNCGKVNENANVCPHCGASVNDGDVFCMECGNSLKETTIITSKDEDNDVYEGMVETKSGFKKFLPYIFGVIVVLVIIVFFYSKNSKGENDSTSVTNLTTVDEVTPEQEMILSIDDIVEFQNLMKGCSGLTNQAKSNYQKARPSIEAIAKKNGFTIYEYHYVNGDLGEGETSSYCCYLYKNCKISKSETGYPTFTPTNNEVCCVLSDGEIIVYDKDSYDELVRQVKEKCGGKLHSETEDDGEESHFYSDGKYCYYMDCVSSGEYRIPIRIYAPMEYEETTTESSDNQQSNLQTCRKCGKKYDPQKEAISSNEYCYDDYPQTCKTCGKTYTINTGGKGACLGTCGPCYQRHLSGQIIKWATQK